MITVDPQISGRQISASVSGLFSLGTDFLNVILSHLSGIPGSGSSGLFLPQNAFLLYILVQLSGR